MTDIFAGAGGSSTGAAQVPGVEVAVAANHWSKAVDVHQQNFPSTRHALVDLHQENPRSFPRTDLLWASPECTKWSQARGRTADLDPRLGDDPSLFDGICDLITTEQEETTRSRLLMFDVLRFVEHHRYRAVVVENVVDIATQPRYARAWELWRKGLVGLGYAYRVVSLNSMHAGMLGLPAPQSRDRLYIVAWPQGERAPDLDRVLSPRAWCPQCGRVASSRQAWKPGRSVGRYRAQYVYACGSCGRVVEPAWLPASAAIDWTIEGQLIGDRKRPLSEKTMARIREGLRRYGTAVTEAAGATGPLHTAHQPGPGTRAEQLLHQPDGAHEPCPTLATATIKGLLVPTEGREGKRAWPDSVPLRTQTTRNELGVLTALRGVNTPKLTSDLVDTVTAGGTHHGLLVPYYSAAGSASPTGQPIGTLTTRDRYALARPAAAEAVAIDPAGCTFRMLQPHEIAAGMAFPSSYIWSGSKRDQVRMAGNAVTPPAARDLVAVVAESVGAQ